MRMNMIGISVLVLATVVVSGVLAADERRGPRILVKDARFDLGRVEEGAQPEHIFEILNTGDDVLEIKQIQPT
jgi:hypothetical protein